MIKFNLYKGGTINELFIRLSSISAMVIYPSVKIPSGQIRLLCESNNCIDQQRTRKMEKDDSKFQHYSTNHIPPEEAPKAGKN